jgi:two-component system nitrate/nitrite sensor histidine kinase NarX
MDTRAGVGNLRQLKWIGIVAPVVFLLALEAVRLAILDPAFGDEAANLLASGLAAAAAVGFGLVLFFRIELAQREIVQQNRDLGLVDAVSIAIQGELDVDQVMREALAAVTDATDADRASIHVPTRDAVADPDIEVVHEPAARRPTDGLSAPFRTVEIPLATGSRSLGHLRLTLSAGAADRLPSPAALQTAGNQVAAAIQIGRLVADLQRRQEEDQTLYQTLLEISNQAPLSQIVATIVRGARLRLGADDARMCVHESVSGDLDGQRELAAAIADGVACQCTDSTGSEPVEHPCPIGRPGEHAVTLQASIWTPGERFGELWLARRTGPPFNDRDRGYLATLAELSAIAITAARLRGKERQGAVLAERDRIARELHDSLAQVLGATHLRLRALVARPDVADRPRTAAELVELADVAEEAYRDVREAILGLREASRPRGLLDSLAAYLEKYSQQAGIRTVLETSLDGDLMLSTDGELQVIRVIQEALTNARKHAHATTARIRIACGSDGSLTIVIEDDGRGFDPSRLAVQRDGGFGLHTMRERIELVGGSLRLDSAPGRGTRVIAMIPPAAARQGQAGRGAEA